MNKNGFTIIELVTSFTLAAVVVIFLFNLIIIVKDGYVINETRASLVTEQAALSEEVNHFLLSNTIKSISLSGSNLSFTTSESKVVNLTYSNNKIQFGNYIYMLTDVGATATEMKVCKLEEVSASYGLLKIDIPLTSSKIPEFDSKQDNYGLKVLYKYDKGNTTLTGVNPCS